MLDYWPTLNFTMDIEELGEIVRSFFLSAINLLFWKFVFCLNLLNDFWPLFHN
jgi:hypothetical protein